MPFFNAFSTVFEYFQSPAPELTVNTRFWPFLINRTRSQPFSRVFDLQDVSSSNKSDLQLFWTIITHFRDQPPNFWPIFTNFSRFWSFLTVFNRFFLIIFKFYYVYQLVHNRFRNLPLIFDIYRSVGLIIPSLVINMFINIGTSDPFFNSVNNMLIILF